MMFDWNDPHQVNETIWGELNENDDHIVPYAKDSEEYPTFTFEECNKKQKNDNVGSITQSTGARNEFNGSSVENSSVLNANEDHSGSRIQMDAWPDLPSLNTELNTACKNENNEASLEQRLMNKMTVQLDSEPQPFGCAGDDNGNDGFLDCDWSNINDFEDLDRMFRNESIFGHDAVTNMDELLASSPDMIGSSMQSISMPDMTLTRDQPSDQGCSSFQLAEHSGEKRKVDDKTADTAETRGTSFPQTPQSNQLAEMDDKKKKQLKSRKQTEERSKDKASQNFNAPWPQNIGQNQQLPGQNMQPFVMASSQAIPTPAYTQQSKINDAENIGSSQFTYTQYGYPAYPFPGIPVMKHVQAVNDRRTDVPVGNYPDPLNYSNSSNRVREMQSKSLAMTPQEKIEKLRRRQQAQAMLAIQQQQQQFGHQTLGAEDMVSQENFQRNNGQDAAKSDISMEENENKLPPSRPNILHVHDNSQRITALTEDNSGKNIYYQLQDSLRKLDIRVRLCIRNSLFRLARSSMERQNASERNSTNKSVKDEHEVPVHEDLNSGDRHTRLLDAETYTNPIDRTVAQLLFHRPLGSCTRPLNDEVPQSLLHNPFPKTPQNIHGTTSEGGLESYGEMDMQASDSK